MTETIRLPADGGCRCGAVRLRVAGPPMLTMACHCAGCQRMTGGAYSLSVLVPSDGFTVTEGAPTRGGLGGNHIHHMHCPRCMSWMFTRIDGMDGFVNIRTTMLDQTGWFTPFIETCTDDKLPWVSVPVQHSFAALPSPEEFGGLVAAYSQSTGPEGAPNG